MGEQLGPLVPRHPSDLDQRIAENGMMLRVLAGSALYGTSTIGGDRDETGVCVEDPATVIGHQKFEQYRFRTAQQRTGDPGACSGPGDLDLTVYSVRKYTALAAAGNPTILLLLFVPDDAICYQNEFGVELRRNRDMFLSSNAADRFARYLHSQRRGLLGLRSGGRNNQGRADIREEFGYDVKFAMHAVRLGFQGCELLRDGVISLPMEGEELDYCREVRSGRHPLEEVLDKIEELELKLAELKLTTSLPDKPNYRAIDDWLESVHMRYWGW